MAFYLKSLSNLFSFLPSHCRAIAAMALLLLTTTYINTIMAQSCSHTEKTVGTSNDYVFTTAPTRVTQKYSYSQAIYTPSEICGNNTNATIYGIAFRYNFDEYYTYYGYSLYGAITRTLKIYLSTTTNNQFTNWETTSLTQVYSGDVTFSLDQWAWITFSTPYNYAGTNNLVVTVNDESNWSAPLNFYFLHDNSPADYNRSIYYYGNSHVTNTSNPGVNYTGRSTHRPWTKFCVDCNTSTPDCTVLTMEDGLRQQLECGTTYCFYDDGGPNSDYYSNNRRDTAIFTANGTITMTFNSLVAEGGDWDHLSVYDGTTPLIEAANSDPGYPLEATSGTMVVVWKTDGSVVKAGWDATITVTECCTPSTLTLSYGTTSASTTAGNSYTNTTLQGTGASNSNIVYTIAPTGQGAYIDENTGEVTIDPNTEGVFTVTATIPRTISTCALSASYTLTVGPCENPIYLTGSISQTIECGKSYCFFDSGGKNGTYSDSQNYTATFTSTGTGITINFDSFVTESSTGCSDWDYIKIYDGDGTDESTLIVTRGQTNCTTNDLIPNQDYTTTTNTMTVKWKSDSSSNAAGWSATISATGCCNLDATIEFGD